MTNSTNHASLQPAAWTPRTIRAGEHDLRIAERGSGGTPLLLMHGIGANIEMWEPFRRRLNGRRVIAFDAPGAGQSPRPKLPPRMSGLASIIRDLLDTLGYEQVDVLGVSFGGALAQELARKHPDRVRRLVLCSTSAGVVCVPPKPIAALALMTPARYYHEGLFNFIMPKLVGGKTARHRGALAAQAAPRLSNPPDVLGYAYQLYAASGWTSAHYLHRLSQRTLVVAGDDDPAIPVGNGRFLACRIPNSELHVVRGGGHAFLLDEPENVAPVIQAFLDGE